jgi:hypothetical protein
MRCMRWLAYIDWRAAGTTYNDSDNIAVMSYDIANHTFYRMSLVFQYDCLVVPMNVQMNDDDDDVVVVW